MTSWHHKHYLLQYLPCIECTITYTHKMFVVCKLRAHIPNVKFYQSRGIMPPLPFRANTCNNAETWHTKPPLLRLTIVSYPPLWTSLPTYLPFRTHTAQGVSNWWYNSIHYRVTLRHYHYHYHYHNKTLKHPVTTTDSPPALGSVTSLQCSTTNLLHLSHTMLTEMTPQGLLHFLVTTSWLSSSWTMYFLVTTHQNTTSWWLGYTTPKKKKPSSPLLCLHPHKSVYIDCNQQKIQLMTHHPT